MARILVTYGWCRTAYVAVKSLHRAGHSVFSCSHLTPSMSAWSRYCSDSAKTVDPFSSPEDFIRELEGLIRRWKIDILVPGHEDALIIREFQDRLSGFVTIACPTLEELQIGVDKLSITRLAEQVGVPVPHTLTPSVSEICDSAEEMGFPLVLKLSRSNSAKGVFAMRSLSELRHFLQQPMAESLPQSNFYLQKFHAGVVVGICFCAVNGQVQASFSERYVRAKNGGFGTSVFREPYTSALLEEYVNKLAGAMGWTGIGHFDFIELEDEAGFVLLEMNPRPWGALNLAYVNGYDFIAALVAHHAGEGSIQKFFPDKSAKAERRCMWIVGESIRLISMVVDRDFKSVVRFPGEVISALRRTDFDDFVLSDPLPLLAEYLCYGKGFVSSGGKVNPG